ncbi:MAG: hypothetical protein KDD21_11485 [Bacteroidetes bacterium]|nr:hypothetical protein [Bacteroidota bacterium]
MKYLFPFVLVFLAIACNNDNQSPYKDLPNEGELKLLTYNVAGLPQGINADQFPLKHMHLVSPLLNAYDIVNVQEDFYYHDSLYKYITLPYKSKYVAEVSLGDGLNTVSTIPILDFKRIKWNQCNGTDCLTPKGFSYCRLRFNDNAYVDLYNVHCNAGSDAGDYAARRDNVSQLCQYIEANSAGNALIVMGDFNCRYTRIEDNIRKMDSVGLTNVWIELIRNGVAPLQDGNSLMDCSPNATNATCEVVDKIYYRSSAKIEFTALSYQLDDPKFYDSDSMSLSDHRPMFANLKYKINP